MSKRNLKDMGYKFMATAPYSGAEAYRQENTNKWAVIFYDHTNDNTRTMLEFIDELEAWGFIKRLEDKAYLLYKELYKD